MSSVTLYTKSGTKSASKITLNKNIFDIADINQNLIHQAYTAYLSNGRANLAKTKTRGAVSGSNKKPWKQKSTGRARVGSKRTPLWRGGGIIFGPTGQENYQVKLNIATKRLAIKHSLSTLNQEKSIKVIESIDLKQAKTSELNKLINKLELNGNILIIEDNPSEKLRLAANNLAFVEIVQTNYINVSRLLNSDHILLTQQSLETLGNWLDKDRAEKEVK